MLDENDPRLVSERVAEQYWRERGAGFDPIPGVDDLDSADEDSWEDSEDE